MAIRGGFSAINSAEWMKVVYGLIFSVVLGFLSGYLSCKLVAWTCRDMDRRKTTGFFRYAQIGGAAAMAFMHGAQDGQKFMGVMLLGICMVNGSSQYPGSTVPSVDAFAGIRSHGPGNDPSEERKSSNPWAWIWCGWRNTRAFPRIWRELPVFSDFPFLVFPSVPHIQKPQPSWVWER